MRSRPCHLSPRGPGRLLRLGRLRADVVKAEHISLAQVLLARAGFTAVAGRFRAALLGAVAIGTAFELRIGMLAEIARYLDRLVEVHPCFAVAENTLPVAFGASACNNEIVLLDSGTCRRVPFFMSRGVRYLPLKSLSGHCNPQISP